VEFGKFAMVQSSNYQVQTIRLWKIEKEYLQEIAKSKVDLEARLQGWITSDVSIISPTFLVIGR
jgi:hypothetical protein